ncbi:hypothetical protein FHG87_007033 [Trinorchestia longiramus]|nr:hypothetical protein FHG87_007033 [Trinorchestia longiramus]
MCLLHICYLQNLCTTRPAKVEDQQLSSHVSLCRHREGEEVGIFDTSVGTFTQKQFSMNDYCFALQSYPKCNYEQFRDFLVLSYKRKLQYITSSIDKDQVLRETFDKVQTLQQKNVFLLVDEVQIRPTVSFSVGLLSGMAEYNRDCKATSILCVMMKPLHKGPSQMISDTRPQADSNIPA